MKERRERREREGEERGRGERERRERERERGEREMERRIYIITFPPTSALLLSISTLESQRHHANLRGTVLTC